MTPIRILLADDHALLRTGLRMLLNAQSDLKVVGEAGTLAETLDELAAQSPDVLILDLTMPGVVGLSGVSRVHAVAPATRIIVLTMHDDPAYARSALALGASGYLVKSVVDSELLNTVRAVMRGGLHVHVGSEPSASDERITGSRSELPLDSLSIREREVLEMVAHGYTNLVVAERLGLSVKTVESYRARLMQKLRLTNRADLMRLAIELGIVLRKSP